MELIKDDDSGVTIRFEKLEFADLLAIVHIAALEYDSLSVDIHNCSKEQFERIENGLFSIT